MTASRVALQGIADLIADLLPRGALVNVDESRLRVVSAHCRDNLRWSGEQRRSPRLAWPEKDFGRIDKYSCGCKTVLS